MKVTAIAVHEHQVACILKGWEKRGTVEINFKTKRNKPVIIGVPLLSEMYDGPKQNEHACQASKDISYLF